MQRPTLLALIASLPLILGGCHDPFAHIRERGRLVVAVESRMPGLIRMGDEVYGYRKELLRAYADTIGAGFEIVSCDPATRASMMRHRQVDMAIVTIPADGRGGGVLPRGARLLCTSTYSLVGRTTVAENIAAGRLSLEAALRGSDILASSGFLDTKGCSELLAAMKGGNVFVSNDDGFRLFEQLCCGGYDFLVCETGEAAMGCALAGEMSRVRDFGDTAYVYVVVNPSTPRVARDFARWLGGYRSSPQFAHLTERFFTGGQAGQYIGNRDFDPGLDISYYDDIIRRAGEREGCDWRLLAAIAFTESRFNLFAASPRGARGMMQVLPSVADSYDIPNEDILVPEINVTAAAKLLHDIRKTLRFDRNTPEQERLSIMLACYNAGLTRVMEARDMVTAAGGDPDSWAEVARYLRRHGQQEEEWEDIGADGNETVGYVDKVLAKYESYKRKMEK